MYVDTRFKVGHLDSGLTNAASRKGLKLCCSSWEAMLVSKEFVVVQRPKSACCYSVEAAQNRLFRQFLRFWKLLGSFNVFCEFSINMFFSLALAWPSAFWILDGPFPWAGLLDTFQAILPFGDLLLGLFCSWAFVTFNFDPFEGPCGASTRTLQSNSWTPPRLNTSAPLVWQKQVHRRCPSPIQPACRTA